MPFLSNLPAWQLLAQSDWMTKFILLGLFSLSIFCTWIVIGKFLALKKQKAQMKILMEKIVQVRTFESLVELSKQSQDCAGGRVLIKMLHNLKDFFEEGRSCLNSAELEQLQLIGDQVIEQIITEEEEYLPVLGTSAAISPLVGLFGTIWGLIHAFINISQEKSADIAVVAPGIAEALITTLGGLFVAIPAMIFFHYFTNQVRILEQQLLVVTDHFMAIVNKSFNQ